MMNAVAGGGGSFSLCAECCSMRLRKVERVSHTASSLSYRTRSRRRQRICFERSAFLEGPRLASYGSRHVLEGSVNALLQRCRSVTKRDVIQLLKGEGQKVKVRFRLDHQVAFGEHLALLGSSESAGSWKNRVIMGWTEAGWVVDLEADPGETIEYKYMVITGDGIMVWEHGANRVLVVPEDFSKYYQVVSHWSDTSEGIDFEVIDGSQAPEGRATEVVEVEVELTKEKGDFDDIDGTQSPADGAPKAEKELTVETIDSESSEGTHGPEGGLTEAQQVEQEGNANGSANLEKSEQRDSESSVIRGEEFSSVGAIEDSRRRVGKWDTTAIDNSSKPTVEGAQNSATVWGKVSILFLLLIICGVVSLGFVSLLKS